MTDSGLALTVAEVSNDHADWLMAGSVEEEGHQRLTICSAGSGRPKSVLEASLGGQNRPLETGELPHWIPESALSEPAPRPGALPGRESGTLRAPSFGSEMPVVLAVASAPTVTFGLGRYRLVWPTFVGIVDSGHEHRDPSYCHPSWSGGYHERAQLPPPLLRGDEEDLLGYG